MAAKTRWKPGNLVVPAPAALISCRAPGKEPNLITLAWCGNINSDPPMLSISVRPSRHSYGMLVESGEFVVNLPSSGMAKAVDYCGVVSGRDVDKWRETGLTPLKMEETDCPGVEEAPINIACRTTQRIALGTHDMFLAEVLGVTVGSRLLDKAGRFRLEKAELLCFAHGEYYELGKKQGKFGWSVRKKKPVLSLRKRAT